LRLTRVRRDHGSVETQDARRADPFDLTGRVAVVTGASSGLGAEVARTLSGAGARVALVARRIDRLEALAGELGGQAVACDLLDRDQVDAVVTQVAQSLGAPTILVNVAGAIAAVRPAEDEPYDQIRDTLDLNLVAPFRLCQQVFPHLVEAGGGAIVHVSSISGRVGIPGIPQASYAASKAGLSGLTAELAVQWAKHRIRVNTVAPGFFRSEITTDLYEEERSIEWLRRNTPLPIEATPADVVGAVLWLVSDAGRYVTGQTVVVDGGWTAR
jgi:NAD(P)-dependent dehydrogenase (short-subunit alcohol dehydrogenase family)